MKLFSEQMLNKIMGASIAVMIVSLSIVMFTLAIGTVVKTIGG